MDEHSRYLAWGYIALAAISGAVTALGFVNWRTMTRGELLLTFVTGLSFAVFVTPWVAHSWFGIDATNTRAVAGLTYVFGSGSNILLPFIIRKVQRLLGNGEGA